ncbi:MAG: hypothetical protein AB1401_07795 [Thermodesulfobacteriota bacterium]
MDKHKLLYHYPIRQHRLPRQIILHLAGNYPFAIFIELVPGGQDCLKS